MGGALVIGFGNSLCSDDGVGPAVVRRLEAAAGETVIEAMQLLPEHIEAAAQADLVVFVDAALDLEPGEVRCQAIRPPDGAWKVSNLHDLSAGWLIEMARDLYGRCPEAWLVTVGAADLSYGEDLSPQVGAAVDRAVVVVSALLNDRQR